MPCFWYPREGQRTLPLLTDSQLPVAENNPYTKVACLGVTYLTSHSNDISILEHPSGASHSLHVCPGWGYGSTPSSFFKCQWPEVESAPELSTRPHAVGISTAGETCPHAVLSYGGCLCISAPVFTVHSIDSSFCRRSLGTEMFAKDQLLWHARAYGELLRGS